MEINAEDFRRLYQSRSDDALQALEREDLVEIARDCYDLELANRGLSSPTSGPVLADPEAEPAEGSTGIEGLVEVTTYSSFQEGRLARAILTSVSIPASLEREHFIGGGVRLMVPSEFLDDARQVLESPLSDDGLAAQAEAEPPHEE